MKEYPIVFRCPKCQSSISREIINCGKCKSTLRSKNGIFNFVDAKINISENNYYNQIYSKDLVLNKNKKPFDALSCQWEDPWAPVNRLILNSIGDINGKSILLLGNGKSGKELFLLKKNPGALIYSDLSQNALIEINNKFELEKFNNILTFAAIDACNLPFFSNTFDLIYGYAMVHHLPNLKRFFEETFRVLKPGGSCVFMDDAYSPVWQITKTKLLFPLMKYSHRKFGISPQDSIFSIRGGFVEEELGEMIIKVGGVPCFRRATFFLYFWERGVDKFLRGNAQKFARSKKIAKALNKLDQKIENSSFYKNLIRLVWGFKKI